ncbi:MAG TPA: sugar phosphate nucleotidyltransferase [Pyrinomonadaceae bacterium]|nr:sugar phosphate nucleotidyltransferase [Pyrinomonadaceae bacterium]
MSAISSQHRFSQKLLIRRAAGHLRRSERWAVILAGGDGTRLQSMTRSITGDDRPKQFVPVIGGSTLLEQTRRRVGLSVLPGHTFFVVTEKHQRFYRSMADGVSPNLLLEQPANKGTAPAILYALMRVAAKSPKAIVALFPSDHYFADDEAFMSHVDAAFDAVQARPTMITLLGITPSSPETEYGWIEPQQSILGTMPLSITRVSRFWEKPDSDMARTLLDNGCLWNSFVMVGRVDALLKMTRRALPNMYSQFASTMPTFETATERKALHALYSRIQESNFSKEVLAARAEDLTVMRVGDVGWSDLGEPARVLSTLARIGVETQMAMSAS